MYEIETDKIERRDGTQSTGVFGGLSDTLFVWDDEDISIQAAICSVSGEDSLSNLL